MYIEYFSVTYPLDIKVNFRFILGNVRGKINMDEFYQDLLNRLFIAGLRRMNISKSVKINALYVLMEVTVPE